MSLEDPGNPASDRAQQAPDGALRLLGERALVNRTAVARHLVALLEILGVGRTIGNRSQVRNAAQLPCFNPVGNFEIPRRRRRFDPLHEFGPDWQRDSCGVCLATDPGRLIEADPDAGHHRLREADEPRVAILPGPTALYAHRAADRGP